MPTRLIHFSPTKDLSGPADPSKSASSRDITILVVEDNVSNFVLIARMLGFLGIHCEWKTSGFEVVHTPTPYPALTSS